MKKPVTRADLHVHSKHSRRPASWVLQKIGAAESYTEPRRLYAALKRNGMDLVTVTDHNVIDACLEIAHLDGTFISEEITTYFPDDKCKIHVLAYGVTEADHGEIGRRRSSVFDLAPYLRRRGIVHAVAHPMYPVNGRLTVDHFEKLLLLFDLFELNGGVDRLQNEVLQAILEGLTPETVASLADRHGIPPAGDAPWRKGVIGGSDDHSGLYMANTFTEMDGKQTVDGFLSALGEAGGRVRGAASCPKSFGHATCSIVYQYFQEAHGIDRWIRDKTLLRFLERALRSHFRSYGSDKKGLFHRKPRPGKDSHVGAASSLLLDRAGKVIQKDFRFYDSIRDGKADVYRLNRTWFRYVNQVADEVIRQFADEILDSVANANFLNVFNLIGGSASVYALLSPYFIGYAMFSGNRQFCNACRRRFMGDGSEEPVDRKMALFTDTFYEINGVATTIQAQISAARKLEKPLTLLTCDAHRPDGDGVLNFKPIGQFSLPEYPELTVFYPPFLQMLDRCYNEGYTHIHAETPGPMGLAALGIARTLGLPFSGTYHTALPQTFRSITGDAGMEETIWRYLAWFYSQMAAVYVPSEATGRDLVGKGVDPGKIRVQKWGVDTKRFHPSKGNGFLSRTRGVSPDSLKLLYVGRVSKEKNLHILVETIRKAAALRDDFVLAVVGDGPYLDEMQRALAGFPAVFTGYLTGEALSQAYASCDIFLFPSTNDTSGNVILEAQASGLPVVVTDRGGPRENLIPEKTGYVVPADDADPFVRCIRRLADDPALLDRMKRAARDYAARRTEEACFRAFWDGYDAPPPITSL